MRRLKRLWRHFLSLQHQRAEIPSHATSSHVTLFFIKWGVWCNSSVGGGGVVTDFPLGPFLHHCCSWRINGVFSFPLAHCLQPKVRSVIRRQINSLLSLFGSIHTEMMIPPWQRSKGQGVDGGWCGFMQFLQLTNECRRKLGYLQNKIKKAHTILYVYIPLRNVCDRQFSYLICW